MSKEKQIFLPVEDKKEMIKSFKTTKETLWAALNFKTDSNFARMLRAAAYERGGVLYPDPKKSKGYIPECARSAGTQVLKLQPPQLWYKVSASGLNW